VLVKKKTERKKQTVSAPARAARPHDFCPERLERRHLLSGLHELATAAAPTANSFNPQPAQHGDYLAPHAKVSPTAKSLFTGQFVVTLANGAGSKSTARAHQGSHTVSYVGQGNKNLWSFPKGMSLKKIQASLKGDKRIVDAYPVYADATPVMNTSSAGTTGSSSLKVLSDFAESEPNNTPGTATPFSLSATPNIANGQIATGTDQDYYSFTIGARSGVFFDIDSRETGLSTTLDSILTVYNSGGTTVIGTNDDGRDWDDFPLNDTSFTQVSVGNAVDSSLYLDLTPGTYYVAVSSFGGTTGQYQLKMSADSSYTASVPALSSKPGSGDTIYLDFDGHSGADDWGVYNIAAYDLNGNAAEWTPLERYAINMVWRVVSEDYAPFDVNVTTVNPGSFNDGQAVRQVIGNSDGSEVGGDGALGISILGSYNGPGTNTAFTFANNFPPQQAVDNSAGAMNSDLAVARAIEMGNTSSHEVGHTLNLLHYGGTNPQPNGIMHTPDFGLNRERWVTGLSKSDEPPVVTQNDVVKITTGNTIAFRADDVGNTRAAATVLPGTNSFTASGIIGQITDSDYFRFTGGGGTNIALNIPENVGNLDGVINLYDGAGNLLASANSANLLSASLSFTLPAAADYYVEVKSNAGAIGEIGQYSLAITTNIGGGPTGSISGRVFRDTNTNNVYEPGGTTQDAPLSALVYIDANGNNDYDFGELNTTSSAVDGTYSFTGLANGTYRVREIRPSGYIEQAAYDITISAGEAYTNQNFGNFPLLYTGTSGNDVYTLRCVADFPARFEILESSSPVVYSAYVFNIPLLTFSPGDGDDRLNIDFTFGNPLGNGVIYDGGNNTATGDSLLVTGSSGADALTFTNAGITTSGGTIALGDGANPSVKTVENTTVNGGNGNDTITLGTSLLTNMTVDGQAGTDTLTYTGTSSADAVTLTSGTLTAGALTHAYANLENLSLSLLAGNDTVNVNHGAGGPATTISGGDGDDAVTVTAAGLLTFNGDNNNDTLNLTGTATSVTLSGGSGTDIANYTGTANADAFTVTNTLVSGAGKSLNYAATEQIVINALGGADTFAVNSTQGANATPVTLNGGDGNDTFTIGGGGNLDLLASAVTVNGDNDVDSVTVNDSANAFGDPYSITASTLGRVSFGGLTYNTVEGLAFFAETGDNLITLTGTNPNTPVTINGSDGNDTLAVTGSPSSAVVFNGGTNPAFTDALNVNGAANFTVTGDAGAGTANLQVNVNTTGTVTFNATQHIKALNINNGLTTLAANGARVLVTDTLSLVSPGKLDLTDNDLIVKSGAIGTVAGTTYNGVSGLVQKGYNGGAWNGAGGIVTSQSNASLANHITTLGTATASQVLGIASGATGVWNGETVAGTAILVKYTYVGDADLNGKINGDDYFLIDSHVSATGANVAYRNGDFNYNGKVDGDDSFFLDSNNANILGTL
jgi:hypothetical protein